MARRVDPVELARALIRRPSVTPADAGALDVLQAAAAGLGFRCHRLPFAAPGTADVDNLYARAGDGGRVFAFAGHTDVVPVGDEAAWENDPFGGQIIDGVLHGAGVIHDQRFELKTVESFDRIVETKVGGALTLLRHLRPGVRWVVLFGSVSGRFGNPGQTDYAAEIEMA